MSDREQGDKREVAPPKPSINGRQQQARAASTKNDDESQDGTNADGSSSSRPRGQTEDPDRTL